MTPQAVEAPPVAHRASRLIRIELAACVSIQEIGRVAGRLQLSALHVAELATVRWIDLVMAHQAIRHLRQSAPIRPVGNLQPAMARLAGILRVELYPQLRARRCEVGLLIDRSGDQRRQIAEFQMQLVIESRQARGALGAHRRADFRGLMTLETNSSE